MSYINMNTTLRRAKGGTTAANGTVPSAGRGRAVNEGAAKPKRGAETARNDYMVDDHDPLDASKALEAADLMMSQMKGGRP